MYFRGNSYNGPQGPARSRPCHPFQKEEIGFWSENIICKPRTPPTKITFSICLQSYFVLHCLYTQLYVLYSPSQGRIFTFFLHNQETPKNEFGKGEGYNLYPSFQNLNLKHKNKKEKGHFFPFLPIKAKQRDLGANPQKSSQSHTFR